MKTFLGRSILLILKVVGGIIAVAAVSFGILLLFITITEYRPQDKEPAEIIGEAALTKESVELVLRTRRSAGLFYGRRYYGASFR